MRAARLTLRTSMRTVEQLRAMLRDMAAGWTGTNWAVRGPPRAKEAAAALSRLDAGAYGICVDCNGRIPAARLKAKPEAIRCVNCQEKHEGRSAA